MNMLQHHEGTSFSRDNQINSCPREWRQNYQVRALAVVQVGSFMNMVIGGKWGKVKKRYLDMVEARRKE